ncbi:MAG: hypothetical protein COT85_07205 [Chlamydiae bacterium CG10_big_fil_rev_8_21_14_0_10_42_34]|nr:MAG: hypothetical protein COT85_07205 [Chlamydiae bacterium CG10_big_fil_rev_8_21_14_0_10_42_34]
MIQRAVRFLHKEPTIWGPLSLLCTVAIAVKTAIPFDLLFLAAAGLFLSARWQLRGFCYSLALLAVVAVAKHAFVVTDHLWQLGIEGSLACAFFITAVSFEQGAAWIESLESQMQNKKAALENIEEELEKVQQTAQEQQIVFQEKVATLQKELDEIQTDHSSILILNEVLRKTSARHLQECETAKASVLDVQRQKELLKAEFLECKQELSRLASTDAVALQNTELMKELNQARYVTEQTKLINETLARLYLRESLKAKEIDSEAASLADQLAAAHREVRRIAEPLEETIAQLENQVASLSFEFEKANQESNETREKLLALNEIRSERNFLKERLSHAEAEIAILQEKKPVVDPLAEEKLRAALQEVETLKQQAVEQEGLLTQKLQEAKGSIEHAVEQEALLSEKLKEAMGEISFLKQQKCDPEIAEQLDFAQRKVYELSQIEPLYKQLKKQFEEKNQILHKTRAELFKADTELLRIKMDKEAFDLDALPKEVEAELSSLCKEALALEEENLELQELVSTLIQHPKEAEKPKKKVKMKLSPDQKLLF